MNALRAQPVPTIWRPATLDLPPKRVSVLKAQLLIARVGRLNLTEVQAKLVSDESLTPERAVLVIADYRRFLILCAIYPDTSFAPSKEIDAAWHLHILMSRQYHADCAYVFGHYLHHQPERSDGSSHREVMAGFAATCWAFWVEFGREVENAPANSCVSCEGGKNCTYGCNRRGGD